METLIINQQNKVNYTKELQQIIDRVLETAVKIIEIPPNSEVSIMIVDNNYIQELNLIYRKIDQPTDVLSFAMNELGEDEPAFDWGYDVNMLGDIVISLEQAAAQSDEYGHSLERELGFLVIHGLLHLLGYDHENEAEKLLMRNWEKKIMQLAELETSYEQ